MGIYVNLKLAGRNPMKFVPPPPRPRVAAPEPSNQPPNQFIASVCDTNLPDEVGFFRGTVRFGGLGIEFRVYAEKWPYGPTHTGYVFTVMNLTNARTKKKVQHRFFRHQIAFKGIKYITRTSAREFTVECYARKPYHIAFQEPENASIFAEVLSSLRAFYNVSALDLLDFVGEPNWRRYDRLLDEVPHKCGLDFWIVNREGVMRSTGGTYRPFGLVMAKDFEYERVLTEITLKIRSYIYHMIAVVRSHMQDYTTLDVEELLDNYVLFKQSPVFEWIKLTPAQLVNHPLLDQLSEESRQVRAFSAPRDGRVKRRVAFNRRLRRSGGRLRKWTAKTARNIAASSFKPIKTLQTRAMAWIADKPSIKSVITKSFRKIFK